MLILFTKSFKKNYCRLHSRTRAQCDERLRLFENEPFHILLDNHPLHGEYAGYRSISVSGDRRAIFYHESDDVVRFIAIGMHHELFGM